MIMKKMLYTVKVNRKHHRYVYVEASGYKEARRIAKQKYGDDAEIVVQEDK
jgi:hypothetical protein